MIDPSFVAFDIDGVFADTMTLFLDIARYRYNIDGIRYEDITCYSLEQCLNIDKNIIEEIVKSLLDGSYTEPLKPIEGAPEVLTRIGRRHSPILFVTARPYLGPIYDWIADILPLDSGSIEIVTTGTFQGKADVLLSKGISYFVEDRLDTCYLLRETGVVPVLFKQPWNRENHPFMEVGSWNELESLIKF
jgi:hypothetical protein